MKRDYDFTTLTALILAHKDNEEKGITFIDSVGKEEFISYQHLYRKALQVLHCLQLKGLKSGDELIFQIEDNQIFIISFWACLLGGIIPVPVSLAHHADQVQKLWRIKNTLNNPSLLISQKNAEKLFSSEWEELAGDSPSFVRQIFTDDFKKAKGQGKVQSVEASQIAFLQFSSGSTGNPKGVVLTHQNVIANTTSAWISNGFNANDVFLSWMPLTHDMGLIGFHLYPLTVGADHCIMPTDLFIRNPLLWMKKATEHQASVTCSPNFGYRYYLNRFTKEKGAELELSSIRIIFNGAEPISAPLTREFMNRLGPYGLNPLSMRAVYGLAEATLQVTHPFPNTPFQSVFVARQELSLGSKVSMDNSLPSDESCLEIVNVGTPIKKMNIKIADKKGKEFPKGHVGIIWIRGESVTSKYYNNTSATASVIGKGGWLNTGDTGFLQDGFLYVVGRVKDIIFMNGNNVYPHDIERILEELDEFEAGKVVACGVPDPETGSEAVAVFVLNRVTLEKFVPLAQKVKKSIASKLGFEVKHVLPIRKIPKTTSGKVKRHALQEEFTKGAYDDMVTTMNQMLSAEIKNTTIENGERSSRSIKMIQEWIEGWMTTHLHLTPADIKEGKTFAGYGMTSMQAVELASQLELHLAVTVNPTEIYSYPSAAKLAEHISSFLLSTSQIEDEVEPIKEHDDNRIAVVGIGCRFPGSNNTAEAFWKFLKSEKSAITEVPDNRWNAEQYFDADEEAIGKMYIKVGGFIDQVDQFDPIFFGISPKEAIGMDPQQRLLLEVCWEALEHAGFCPSKLRGSDTGVFIGMGTDDYQQVIQDSGDHSYFDDAFSGLGIERSIAAGRIGYVFDFHGPVMQSDTACSSSLLSIHQACQNLLLGECSLALAGGVNLMLSPETTIKLCRMKALSPTGRCKTFDDEADGYVRGEGAGIVVLKRYSDAMKDGDQIWAVIKGSAVNHDGLSNGITAPNGIAQGILMEKALANAGLTSKDVQYVESHGTGTRLGDPVEVKALQEVYGKTRSSSDPLLVGAVKTNIGHLESAAGIAGFIKMVLCLKNREIPASLNFHRPNQFIPWNEMAIKVVEKTIPWSFNSQTKRRGAISSFGLSGTNVHIVLEEADEKVIVENSQVPFPSYPVILSAKTLPALHTLAQEYSQVLNDESLSLSTFSYSTALTRDSFKHKVGFIAHTRDEAVQQLNTFSSNSLIDENALSDNQDANIVWLFTGQGSQYWGMGKALYEYNATFKSIIDTCDQFLSTRWKQSLVSLLYASDEDEGKALLQQTYFTQPAVFALQCALVEVWRSWGIQPSLVCGHSVGEYAAAYAAGVFSLEDGLYLIAERARLMQSIQEPGSMAVVFTDEDTVLESIRSYGRDLAVAAINGPKLTVVSGKKDSLDDAITTFKDKGIHCKGLSVSHAFHSPWMEPIVNEFYKAASLVQFKRPSIRVVSNVTGKLETKMMADASYWCRHIVDPVLFSQSMVTIDKLGRHIMMEIGPHPSLLSMVPLTALSNEPALLSSMQRGCSSWDTMLQCLVSLYLQGVSVNWKSFFGSQLDQTISLPHYPFQRKRYWIGNNQPSQQSMNKNYNTLKKHQKTVAKPEIIKADLASVFADLLKISEQEIPLNTPFLELGADSMVLASAVRRIEKKYSLNFSIRQLFGDLNTIHKMADYIVANTLNSSPEEFIQPAFDPYQEERLGTLVDITPGNLSGNGIRQEQSQKTIVQRQLDIMEQMLKLQAQQLEIAPVSNGHASWTTTGKGSNKNSFSTKDGKTKVWQHSQAAKKNKSIFPGIQSKPDTTGLTEQQQVYLNDFIQRYVNKTKTSKEITQHNRSVLADNRLSVGFRFSTKEIHYPLQITSSSGSKITDVDGNEYVDLTMGFGVNLFGHRPEAITKAIREQLDKGFQLGPQTPLTGEVATCLASMTGMDRVSFHNSGTEAVMTAVRLARAATGRKKIAIFKGAYHGHFDGTLAVIENEDENHQGVPLTLGILDNMVVDILMFDYTNPNVTKQIEAYAHELAAVLVEPVQSRNPGYQPKELLQDLRAMTEQHGIVLIFDEMITGFRIHPGGAQAHFGVKADLATYGKIVGGGMPIGIIAGRRSFMDALDGGHWQYGDQSYPEVDTTYFAGTFCKHPLSMASSLALLHELQRQGPALQEQLNERTTRLVQEIDQFFVLNQVPIRVHNFGSLFHFSAEKNMDLFFYHLIERGVYVWEGRTSFLSTAHTDNDIEIILTAIKEVVAELQYHGFLPEPPHSPDPGRTRDQKQSSVISPNEKAIHQRVPLSFSQERMWMIDQIEGSVAYQEPAIYRAKGALQVDILEKAFHMIVSRHESLRTVIKEDEGELYQEVLDDSHWHLSRVDGASYRTNQTGLDNYVQSLTSQPFNLSEDYMLRAHLITLLPDEHILVLTMHHVAFDAWSQEIILKELITIYDALVENRRVALDPLQVRYTDFAKWQRTYLSDEALHDKLVFWKNRLEDVAILNLPTDYTRPAVLKRSGQVVTRELDKALIQKLQKMGQQQGATLYMTMLAAYNILLYRYTGNKDICVGSPIAGRENEAYENVVGFFVNTLALRSNLENNPSFVDLLQQVKNTLLEAYEHQEVPFEKVVEVAAKTRIQNQSPLFQTMFFLQDTPDVPVLSLGSVDLVPVEIQERTAKFDLTFSIIHDDTDSFISVEYDTSLFKKSTIERLLSHYTNILHGITQDSSQCISRFSMLELEEVNGLLHEFNGTKLVYPEDKTLVDLFNEQVDKNPEATALVFEGTKIDYRTLWKKSNQLARYLREQGVKKEDLVALVVERSPEMIVGILGILKAGAAYVPIDPSYPKDRISYMLLDAKVKAVLTQAQNQDSLPEVPGQKVILLDEDWPLISSKSSSRVNTKIYPSDLAYVIYTSGSTGMPKGVMVEHHSVVNLVVSQSSTFDIQTDDQIAQFSNYCFDASVEQIFLALLNGASLVLVPQEILVETHLFQRFLVDKKITHLHATPSFLMTLPPAGYGSLKRVIAGGEMCPEQLPASWTKFVDFYNEYGPTETTVTTTMHVIKRHKFSEGDKISIGSPIGNTSIFILDEHGNNTPIGVPGEIYVAGPLVARGYLGQPSLTRERFVHNPFSSDDKAIMYRTGDLGCWLSDGNIEYIGRLDDQVKVRGYRIELGEIEYALQQCPDIRQSVVIVRDFSGNKQLVGYVVKNSPTVNIESVIAFLQAQLPEYMIPTLVAMDALPLTSNGKIDKKALPEPGSQTELDKSMVPQNPLEQQLSILWKSLLGVERIGIHDNFFVLGGHSLLATRMVSAIRKELGVTVSIKNLFEFPTVHQLANFLRNQQAEELLPVISVYPKPDRIPLSYSQERLWFIDLLHGSCHYHIPAVMEFKGALEVDVVQDCFWEIINRHESLRTVIKQSDGVAYQEVKETNGWSINVIPTIPNEDEVASVIKELTLLPFDLSMDYMLRVDWIKRAADEHWLVVVLHHIASDGWSMPILLNEFKELYLSKQQGRAAVLDEMLVQYTDYALWQRDYLPQVSEKSLTYWVDQLSGVSSLALPTDFARPAIQSMLGGTVKKTLPKDLVDSWRQLSQREGVTLFMSLLAAFKVLLYRYSGQGDICVGTPIANRGHKEIESLIGFFANTIALRNQVSGEKDFSSLLQQIKASSLEAFSHQEIPFEEIVDALGVERDLSRSPLFQVMFVFQTTPDEISEQVLGDVSFTAYPVENDTTKFDLTLSVAESSENLELCLEYSKDLYAEHTALRMLSHFEVLLNALIENPKQSLGLLPILTQGEHDQVMVAFNKSECDYPKEKSLVQLFEEQASSYPNAIAVAYEDKTITYQELHERSNQLANYLIRQGVSSETLVALCIDRSLEMVIGILGVLKSGGAYVPIDPTYPQERIDYLLEDIDAKIVVSTQKFESMLSEDGQQHLVLLDEETSKMDGENTSLHLDHIKPTDLAYIIYTSGSTGTPKGVMVEHKAIINLITGRTKHFNLGTDEKIFLFSSYCFDASVEQIFVALLNGATLVIPSQKILTDNQLLEDFLEASGITTMYATPAYLSTITPRPYQHLKRIVCGGEATSISLISKWTKFVDYYNEYGPTEAAVTTTSHKYEKGSTSHVEVVTIGTPVDNALVFILDSFGNPMPIGVSGELFIGGAGLARGYFNRTTLTEERFVMNPQIPGKRLYKTGDMARWLADGTIEYLGRVDDQVKVRGYRVELGEIEYALMQHPLVHQCTVMAKEDSRNYKRLVAYVVAREKLEKKDIHQFLTDRLPEYMVPLIVELDSLPLTTNGKVDKKLLPDPDLSLLQSAAYEAPRNVTEEKLAQIWKALLGLDKVGIHDNFFEVGGDSIITIQVVSRAKQEGIQLQPRDIFQHQTIAKLSENISEQTAIEAEQGLLTGESPLLPIQRWFFDQQHVDQDHYNQAIMLEVPKDLGVESLASWLSVLVEQHDALRFRYGKPDQDWKQYYGEHKSKVTRVELEADDMKSLSSAVGEVCEQAQRSLDIEQGEVMRAVLLETPTWCLNNKLLLAIHHLIVDGVSWRILLEDLEVLVRAENEGRELTLGVKTSSYREWAQALQAYASTSASDQLAYWTSVGRSFKALPTDKVQNDIFIRDIQVYEATLSRELTETLLKEVSHAYNTEINDLLMAALMETVYKWTGDPEVVVGLEGHGREDISDHVDISHTVGWFTNMYPVLLRRDTSASLADMIMSIREQLRSIPDKGVGYGALRYLHPDHTIRESLSGKPWDILFNYLGQLDHVTQPDSLFTIASDDTGKATGENNRVTNKLEINCSITNGQLVLQWGYSEHQYHHTTIELIANQYLNNLESLIHHCQQVKHTHYSLLEYGLSEHVNVTQFNSHDVENVYPVSPMQQGFLFYSLMDSEAQTYFIQSSIRFVGNLQVDLVRASFNQVISRHAILRTAFIHHESGIPLQVVLKNREVDFEFLDTRDLRDDKEKEWFVEQVKEEDKNRLFNLSSDVLMRVKIVQCADNQFEFIWSTHHIVMDGWCIGIIMTEFFEIYYSLCQNKEPLLPLVRPYQSYVSWLFKQSRESSVNYWSDYLSEYNQLSSVPYTAQTNDYGYKRKLISLYLGDERSKKLHKLAQKFRLTFNTVMQAAWGILLSKYNGRRDVVFGAVVSGRPPEIDGIESMVGLFINTVPVRVTYDANTTLPQLLQEIQRLAMESGAHHYHPLAEIQNQSVLKQNLLDHIMVMSSYPLDKRFIEGLDQDESIRIKMDASALESFEQTNYNFNIMIHPDDSVKIDFGFNENVYDLEFIRSVQKHFVQVMDSMLNDDTALVDDLEFMNSEERQQILLDFNATSTPYPDTQTIHGMFEEQVAKTPAAVALVYKGRTTTYDELNRQVNRLAHYLRLRYDIKPDTIVGLLPDRDESMIIGLLAILKAGGAYLPIDPEIPNKRIGYILENAQVPLVLTGAAYSDRLRSENYQGEVLILDEILQELISYEEGNPLNISTPDNLAYVIYTSGSTGHPKGVMINHRSNVNMSLDQVRQFDVTQADGVLQFASISFDASISEICMAFYAGATLVLIDKETIRDHSQFMSYLQEHQVNVVTLPPSYLALLPLDRLDFLKTIITAGEAPKIKDVAFLHTRTNYYNAYGPTECAVCVTINKVDVVDEQDSTLPIGKPIANYRCYILNDLKQPLPVGMLGEICVAGVGLGRGYLYNPTLTNEKFVTSPYINEPILYRTGDLGKWLPDGRIEFVGRIDTQIKVRGYRIELGEIENTLLLHPKIQDCAVVARKNDLESEMLAYVIQKKQIELWPSLSEYFVYDEILYNTMANDQLRNEKYKNAFRKVLKDKVVLEIGPGKEVILSRLAIEEGARKVYAVEILEESYRQAQETVIKYGLEDKITVIHGDITTVELPELADYCISEIVGPIGGSEGSAKLINASKRLLKDPACMIPSRSLTSIAAITLPEGEFEARFEEVGAYYVNKVFEQVGYKFDLRLCLNNFPKKNVISSYDVLEDLDYTQVSELESSHDIYLQIQEDSVFHGFIVWLNLYCDPDEVINTLENKFIWLPVYFPVMAHGVKVKKGDGVKAKVTRTLCDNNLNPDFKVEGMLIVDGKDIPFVYNSYHNASIYQDNEFYRQLFDEDQVKIASGLDKQDVRNFLGEHLPDYMVPSQINFLDKFPLNNSGKVDRKALLEAEGGVATANYVAPRNAIETTLTFIWEDVLGKNKIGVFDNFFDLGGHSLKAIQVKSLMEQTLETTIDLKYLFNYPTIESLARALNEGLVEQPSYIIQLNRVKDSNPNIFCLPPSIGTSIVYKGLADKLEGKFNCYGLQCKGIDDDLPLESTMEELAATFVEEIIQSKSEDTYTLVGYSFGGSLIFEMAKQLEAQGKQVNLINIDKGLDLDFVAEDLLSGEEFDKEAEKTLGFWYQSLRDSDLVKRSKKVNEELLKLELNYVKRGQVNANYLALESLDNEDCNHLEEWSPFISGSFVHVYLKGNHLQLLDEEHLPEAVQAIEQWWVKKEQERMQDFSQVELKNY